MKITSIVSSRQDKSGNPYISLYSKKEQARVAIKVDDPNAPYAGQWISTFVELGDPIEVWKVGQDVDITIVQKGNNWNFKSGRQGGGRNGQAELNNPIGNAWEKLFTKLNLLQVEIEKVGRMVTEMHDNRVVAPKEKLPPLNGLDENEAGRKIVSFGEDINVNDIPF